MRRALFRLLFVAMTACAQPPPEVPRDLCDALARRCGGMHVDNWVDWCRGECVPEYARTVACDANADCLLCDADRTDAQTIYFGLPQGELEYLWTLIDTHPEPVHPPTPAPTGTAFHDRAADFAPIGSRFGAWESIEPYAGVVLGEPRGFCEPGPNQFVHRNVRATEGGLVLRAERMPADFSDMYCRSPECPWGPYAGCGPALGLCPYGDIPETRGVGSASQVDRTLGRSSEPPTYGYGRYRGVLRASDGESVGPQPGFVYTLFAQSNAFCAGGAPNLDTNTAEIDVELSSGPGRADTSPFCNERDMCIQVSTWVSSTQGIAYGGRGLERHEVSGFRFRDRNSSARFRTYGWDWAEHDVRFTYDPDPDDCDESAGACRPSTSSVAICRHVHYVPRRPSPMHAQIWNARWAGAAPPGTRAAMSVRDVWHEPAR